MKEFIFTYNYKGINLKCRIVAKYKKQAASIFDVSSYFISTYGHSIEPVTDFAIKNPLLRVAEFELSGEAPYFLKRELIGKPMKYIDAIAIIDNHRKKFGSYRDTLEYFNKNNYEIQYS